MNKKKIFFIALIAVLSIGVVIIWATGTQDYRTVVFKDDDKLEVSKPTAQFSLTHNGTSYTSPTGTNLDSFLTVVNATVGDTVSIKDLSHSNRGKTLKAWDFQFSTPGGDSELINTKAFEKSYTLDTTGTYTFSLCVRDTVENEAWTSYWGNWSENGNHQVIGHNPGKDLSDPEDDFDGYWYFTRIVVIVSEKTYTLQEKHIASDSGTVLDDTLHEGITESSLTTRSKSFDGYDFIGSRAGYTWSEIANGTTENISSRTANFDSSHKNAFHYYYYKKTAPPPQPTEGKASIVVYYKDKVSGAAVHPADETTYKDVNYGTYTIAALPAPEGYTLDSLTPSPQTVTVDSVNNYKEVLFLYQPDEAPSLKPPVAVLTGPIKAVCGDNIRIDASNSHATEEGAEIVSYIWDIDDLRQATSFDDKDKRVSLWSDDLDGGHVTISVTVIDSNGMTDTDSIEVEITEPVPVAKFDITGNLKQNRKITVDGTSSDSGSQRFDINWDKSTWTITSSSGTLTANDIKMLIPYTIVDGKVKITGVSSFDFISNGYGNLNVDLKIWSEPDWL